MSTLLFFSYSRSLFLVSSIKIGFLLNAARIYLSLSLSLSDFEFNKLPFFKAFYLEKKTQIHKSVTHPKFKCKIPNVLTGELEIITQKE